MPLAAAHKVMAISPGKNLLKITAFGLAVFSSPAPKMWILAVVVIILVAALVWSVDLVNLHRSLPSAPLNELGAWASIYGFVVSLAAFLASGYAAWGISQLKSRLLARARLPTLIEKLRQDASQLSKLAKTSPVPQPEKTLLFSSLSANLVAVRRHLPRHIRPTQKDAKITFARLSLEAGKASPEQPLSDLGSFWPTCELIHSLTIEVEHYLDDTKWEAIIRPR
jgi:hypothetical protein